MLRLQLNEWIEFNQVNFMQIPWYIQSFILARISQGTSFLTLQAMQLLDRKRQFDPRAKLDFKFYNLFKRAVY